MKKIFDTDRWGRNTAITTLPMHYTYGLSVINSHLLKGATILLTQHSTKSVGQVAGGVPATCFSDCN